MTGHRTTPHGSLPEWELMADHEYAGPREDWYCACHPPILHSPLADWCMTCRVAAPWMDWKVVARV